MLRDVWRFRSAVRQSPNRAGAGRDSNARFLAKAATAAAEIPDDLKAAAMIAS
jgi:hypothetical protein